MKNGQAEKYVKNSVDYILSLQRSNGNFPTSTENKDKDLVHWCHGAGGI
jgi:hypothetical protein